MKNVTKLLLAIPLSLSLSLGLMAPTTSPTYAKTKQKVTKKKNKVGTVSKIKKNVARYNKKQAKITLSWKKAKNAKAYEISLKMTVKTKLKKVRKHKLKRKPFIRKSQL